MSPTPASNRSRGAGLPDLVPRQFDRGNPDFHHRQLYSILQRGVRESVLPAGTRLPPSRTLAQALGIARNTVVHVYEQLSLEGYVQARVGRGTFVGDVRPRLVPVAVPAVEVPQAAPRKNLSGRRQTLIDDAGAARMQWGAFTPGVPGPGRLRPGWLAEWHGQPRRHGSG